MRRVVIVVPELLVVADGGESPLRQRLPVLAQAAEAGSIVKISPVPRVETPEALLLGMPPREAQMAQGPLTVSALDFDPPERSTHFHLSLLSLSNDRISTPRELPTPEEADEIWRRVKRLDTPHLTLLRGEELDHALVWESLGDLGTTSPKDIEGRPMRDGLPEGDGDRLLRRLIDDSINLLFETEFNQRRIDEGRPPLNLLWPWGHGVRRPVPNLLLRRGEPVMVESGSLRLAGLTRLTGYAHGDRHSIGRGTQIDFESLALRTSNRPVTLVVFDFARELGITERAEELHWLVRELDHRLLSPLLETGRREATRISFLAPSEDGVGLGLEVEPMKPGTNHLPFDERTLDERRLPIRDLWTLVESGLAHEEPA